LIVVEANDFLASGLREGRAFEFLAERIGNPDARFVAILRTKEKAAGGLAVD